MRSNLIQNRNKNKDVIKKLKSDLNLKKRLLRES